MLSILAAHGDSLRRTRQSRNVCSQVLGSDANLRQHCIQAKENWPVAPQTQCQLYKSHAFYSQTVHIVTECHFTGRCDTFEHSPARSKHVGLSNNLFNDFVMYMIMYGECDTCRSSRVLSYLFE